MFCAIMQRPLFPNRHIKQLMLQGDCKALCVLERPSVGWVSLAKIGMNFPLDRPRLRDRGNSAAVKCFSLARLVRAGTPC